MNQTDEFISQAIFRLNENTPRIEKCLRELSEEDVWKKPNNSSNSVGNLILHICGNITQYVITSLGEQKDQRKRDEEFDAVGGYTKAELLACLNNTIHQTIEVLRKLDEKDLLQVRSVQGFQFSGIGNIIHIVEHYSYHTGQIALWTKLLIDRDLGFYAGVDLNQKNKITPEEK